MLGTKERLLLWCAQGFGVGRVPVASGTFGSLIGLLWFALLLQTGALWSFLVGTALGLAFSVWGCGSAERLLGRSDPPSVVLDEMAAIPACFLTPVVAAVLRTDSLPSPDQFFLGKGWLGTALVFLLFRVFDIWKPWPVRQSQRLPGGWGVTVDDALAATYVNLIQLVFAWAAA